jgi:exodeoxyribonuclease-3
VFLNPSQNKHGGEHGTMTATRHKPLSVSYGIGVERHDMEGRVIVLE